MTARQIMLGVSIKTGKAFHLPADFVTQTVSIIARKGAGKTYTGSVAAEEMLEAGDQVVVIDPLDVWWGLRSSADGKSKGFSIVVFGGEHGDLPLTEHMGAQIADAIVEHHMSAVLSLDHLSKNGQRTFMTAFAEQLYQKKNPSTARSPMHLMIDEADMFCPQRVMHGQERMLGAVDSLVRRGRTRGIGVTMITQRPATIHKDVFTQTEVLIALQLTSPQDRKAVEEWVQGNDTHGHRAEFMASLASLRVGQAWVWSPSWLECFEQVQIRKRHTFNSSATPKAGDKAQVPKARAEVDLDALRTKLAQVIDDAKANDPTALKKEIANLKRELAAKPTVYQSTPEETLREVNSAVNGERQRLLAEAREAFKPLQEWLKSLEWASKPHIRLKGDLPSQRQLAKTVNFAGAIVAPSAYAAKMAAIERSDGAKLGRAERRILTALAQYPEGRSKTQAAVLTGYAHSGGGFNNALSALRSNGYIEAGSDHLKITGEGLVALGPFEELPTGKALLQHWLGEVGKAERLILGALANVWPNSLSKEDVGTHTGYAPDGGGFNNAISRLRTLELIEGRGDLRASNHLMEG